MSQSTLSPEETKRMQEALRRDPHYTASRHNLLWVSVICAVFLAFNGLMVMFDRFSFSVSVIGITGCILVYFYFMIRVTKARNAAEARWMHGQVVKKEKKKERRKNR